MSKLEFRLGEIDQGKYPRGDEWFVFDTDALDDLPASKIAEYEEEMDYTLGEMHGQFVRRGASAIRAAMWLSRALAGVKESYVSFDPSTRRMEARPVRDEVGLPDLDPTPEATEPGPSAE